MRIGTMLAAAALAMAPGVPAARADGGMDALRYELEVVLRGKDLVVSTTIRAAGRPTAKWDLELVPEMKILSAESGGKPLPFAVAARGISLDLSGAAPGADGSFTVTVRCEGSPSERFSKERGGFVRTAVGPDLVYVRSQVPWYPRAADDPAVHRVVVDAPAGWEVRSAGECTGARTFETKGPVDRVGLAAGPWKVVTEGGFDALVLPGHEKPAEALLALAKKAMEVHATDLGPLPRRRYSLVELPKEFGTGSGYSECGYILLGPGAFEAGPTADWVPAFLGHETAHQWWGHDGLFSDFANEGLAEFGSMRFLRATSGTEAADRMRRAAADRLGKAATGGKSAALSEVRGWGGNMDAETYQVAAYQRSMLLLAAVEDAVGPEGMTALLRGFLETARGKRVGWTDLRSALCAAGPAAKAAVEKWEGRTVPQDGVPAAPPGEAGAKALLDGGMKVANNPGEADPKVLGKAIEDLRAARKSKDLNDGEKAAAQTGIGRCLFRLGKLDDAEKELEEALTAGAGGPFHRAWANLRLGNIDDLRGRRKEALVHYKAVVDNRGASATTLAKAKAFLEKPYRGFKIDG